MCLALEEVTKLMVRQNTLERDTKEGNSPVVKNHQSSNLFS